MFWDFIRNLFGMDDAQKLLAGKIKQVEVEGVKFHIKRLPTAFVFELQQAQARPNEPISKENLYRLIAESICNKRGKSILTPEQVAMLDMVTLEGVSNEIMAFNNLGDNAQKEALAQLKN